MIFSYMFFSVCYFNQEQPRPPPHSPPKKPKNKGHILHLTDIGLLRLFSSTTVPPPHSFLFISLICWGNHVTCLTKFPHFRFGRFSPSYPLNTTFFKKEDYIGADRLNGSSVVAWLSSKSIRLELRFPVLNLELCTGWGRGRTRSLEIGSWAKSTVIVTSWVNLDLLPEFSEPHFPHLENENEDNKSLLYPTKHSLHGSCFYIIIYFKLCYLSVWKRWCCFWFKIVAYFGSSGLVVRK